MNKKKTVALTTLGCKVNQYDTDAVLAQFLAADYDVVDFSRKADVYVINTCTVTNLGDRKSRQMIRRAHKTNPEAVVVVMGCLAQTSPEQIAEIEGVNLILGTDGRGGIVEEIEGLENKQTSLVGDIFQVEDFEDLPALDFSGRTRATLKIQDGCDQFCTYCRVPFARGPSRSRSRESVLEQVDSIIKAGYHEIVLTGIHLGLYGRDLNPPLTLEEITGQIAETPGLKRLRISSVNPHEITPGLMDLITNHPVVCRHLHIPLQSGSDAVLKRMKRDYSSTDFLNIVNRLRREIPEIAITTDIMVGFPGETEEDFAKTVALAKKAAFNRIHVFRYSRRAGTAAARFKGQIPGPVKEKRSARLIEIGEAMALDFHLSFVGKTVWVLVEQVAGGLATGLTDNYIRTSLPWAGGDDIIGEIVPVQVKSADHEGVEGGN